MQYIILNCLPKRQVQCLSHKKSFKKEFKCLMHGSYLRLQCSGRYVCVLFRNDIVDHGLLLCRLIIC